MKGKLSIRFDMPNVNRFRSRVENPSKDLTSKLREHLADVVSEVVNENQTAVKAKMIKFVDTLNLKYKSEQHKLQVQSVVNSIFDTICASTPEKLTAITGNSAEEDPTDEAEKGEVAKDEKEFE